MAGDTPGGLTFVLDENLGGVLELLRGARVRPEGMITNLEELGFPAGANDEDWMPELGKRGSFVAITRGGEILNAAVRRNAFRSSGIRLLMLDKKWGLLPIRDLVRALFYLCAPYSTGGH